MTRALDPLTPQGCDLRDFPFMPIDVLRLFASEFHAVANDAEWRAGVTLWLKSWQQIPAGSLPDDDVQLARIAEFGRDVASWREVKDVALHRWVRCSDGRLYHPVVAEKVLEAWRRKEAFAERKSQRAEIAKKAAAARWSATNTSASDASTMHDASPDALRDASVRHASRIDDAMLNQTKDRGQGTGDKGHRTIDAAAACAHPRELAAEIASMAGVDQRSPAARSRDVATAEAWLDQGFTRTEIADVVRSVVANTSKRINSLAYFTPALHQARAEAREAMKGPAIC